MLANGSPRLAVCLFRRLLPWVQACPRGGVRRGPLRHDPAENSSRRGGDLHATRAAQSQCRTTIEALAEIKNPPIVYARQANFRPPVCEVSAARGPATGLRRITCCLLVQIGWVRSLTECCARRRARRAQCRRPFRLRGASRGNLLQRPRMIVEAAMKRPAVLVVFDLLELVGKDLGRDRG